MIEESIEHLNRISIIEAQAVHQPNKPYLLFDDERISFKQYNENINSLANGLPSIGVRKGEGIGILLPNSPRFLYLVNAAQKIGLYSVPINTSLIGDGLKYVLEHSDISHIVLDHSLIEEHLPIIKNIPRIRSVIVDTHGALDNFAILPGTLKLESLFSGDNSNPVVKSDYNSMVYIIYTSGTTGLPKGVVFRNKLINGPRRDLIKKLYSKTDIIYTCLPLFHSNALMITCDFALRRGCSVALDRRFSASRFWSRIRHYNATTFNSIGSMIPILMKQPERPDDKDNRIRMVLDGGCPANLWEAFERRFKLKQFQFYGAVDGAGYILVNLGGCPVGSVGRPLDSRTRILDLEMNDAKPHKVGELSFQLKDGRKTEYYKNLQASADRVFEGWFRTGDLFYSDDAGNHFFVDRKTDFIRRRGENISTFEIEREVNKYDSVLESAAYGVPSELGEDDVMVAVVARKTEIFDPRGLVSFLEDKMAYFMIPRYIRVLNRFEKTETHRVKKTPLKRQGITENTWDREMEVSV